MTKYASEDEVRELATEVFLDAKRAAMFKNAKDLPPLKPHRCAYHLDDLLTSMANFEIRVPFKYWVACMRSEPGNEPDRYPPAMALKRTYAGRKPRRALD